MKLNVFALTHGGRDKMAAMSQTTFSNEFSWMKTFEFRLRFGWNLFLRFELTTFQHLFRWWLGADQVTSHYLNQWWSSLLTHICVTLPQWVNVLFKSCCWILGYLLQGWHACLMDDNWLSETQHGNHLRATMIWIRSNVQDFNDNGIFIRIQFEWDHSLHKI